MRIAWSERVTNALVLIYTRPKAPLMSLVLKLALRYFGHISRARGLEYYIMTGKVEGSRRRGRQRSRWVDFIKKETGTGIRELCEKANERSEWRNFVQGITKSRPRLNGL